MQIEFEHPVGKLQERVETHHALKDQYLLKKKKHGLKNVPALLKPALDYKEITNHLLFR